MTEGPRAPKDPEKQRSFFYIMRNKEVAGSPAPDGRGVTFLYQNDGRMISSARIVGGISDETMLTLLQTTEGFRRLVHSIGVTAEGEDSKEEVSFAFQMYGKTDPNGSGTTLRLGLRADGAEKRLVLADCDWSSDDSEPGQIRFGFEKPGTLCRVWVRFFLQDGFEAPRVQEEEEVDFFSAGYRAMIARSLVQTGNTARLRAALQHAGRGEDVTVAFIGGSITQGAGAVPIHTGCYAYRAFAGFCRAAGRGTEENIHYCKAGVGGTPSELGMIRYERDVCREGRVLPDVVVVEFAVNDEGDETKGECYDSLVRKILNAPNRPAVILLFAVFVDDWNLQERLSVVGEAYDLPMVSIRDAVKEQFYRKPGEGRVVSKNQFFYDRYHPTNVGHRIMADCLIRLFEAAGKEAAGTDAGTERAALPEPQPSELPLLEPSLPKPPLGGAFETVALLDRKQNPIGAVIDCGDFDGTDTELQGVERDLDLGQTPQFPYNWKHGGGMRPFRMEIACRTLLLVYKDSGSVRAGRAQVLVDGEPVLLVDPRAIGWTHCNPLICFREREKKTYHVEIRMCPGDEGLDFTILGFGYVA